MFEGITAPRRHARHRKSALALALLLNISGVGSLMSLGGAQDIIEVLEDPLVLVEPIFAPAPAPAAPPAAAFSPPSAPKETIKPPKEKIIEEPPVEPVEPTEPTEPAETPEFAGDAVAAVGLPDGPASTGGCPPGMICDGEPTDPGTGCPPGQICSDTTLYVTAADVQPKRRVKPKYPAAAKAMNISEARCLVRFTVNEKGHPTDVQVSGCPNVFHDEVTRAAWAWRFYPVRDAAGVKTAAMFTLALNFRLN